MSKDKANERIDRRANTTAPADSKKSKTAIIIIIAVIIVCILVGIIIFLLFGKESTPRNVVVTPENIEQIIKEIDEAEYTAPGSYEVNMNTEWIFLDGKAASKDAYVENSVRNQNTVYFIITLPSDKDRVIYHSPYLEIGSHIEEITLDEDLDAGVYDAVLTYHLVDAEMKDLSEVSVSITITVQN